MALETAANEIKRLQASDEAWRIIVKQEKQWAALPASEREKALNKALEDTTADHIKAEEENGRLRKVIERLGSSEAMECPFVVEATPTGNELRARLQYARDALTETALKSQQIALNQ